MTRWERIVIGKIVLNLIAFAGLGVFLGSRIVGEGSISDGVCVAGMVAMYAALIGVVYLEKSTEQEAEEPTSVVVQLHPQVGRERCPYCHDPILGDPRLVRCDGCAATFHAECLSETQSCTTLGCCRRVRGRVHELN